MKPTFAGMYVLRRSSYREVSQRVHTNGPVSLDVLQQASCGTTTIRSYVLAISCAQIEVSRGTMRMPYA